MGLNLLRLLLQNRIAEFHVEVELLGPEARASPHVAFPRELEQQLMEGTYERVFGALEGAPSPRMRAFLKQLQATVREELAACAAAVRSPFPPPFVLLPPGSARNAKRRLHKQPVCGRAGGKEQGRDHARGVCRRTTSCCCRTRRAR